MGTGRWKSGLTRTFARAVWLCVSAWLFASATACDGCGETRALATLLEARDEPAQRDFAASLHQWQTAEVGARFAVGDGIRTGKRGTARLELIDQTQLELAPETTLRFLVDGQQAGESALNVESGEVALRVGASDLLLRTQIGVAKLWAGTSITLTREGENIDYRVRLGLAQFRDSDGTERVINAGEDVEVGIGMAVMTRTPPQMPDPEPVVEPLADAGPAAEPAEDAHSRELTGAVAPSLEYFNLSARAGESFVLHAPELPVAVSFDFSGKCPYEGVVELPGAKQKARGKDRVSVSLQQGSSAYSVRCVDEKGGVGRAIARGSVQVLRDAGTRKLPPKAPTSMVDADGRLYTIHYQNQPPEVLLRWPNAPSAARYELILDGQSSTLPKAEHLFRSGSLRDGTHQLSFRAGDRRSRTTTVEVRFDNAAPKASLSSPADREFRAGDTVTIEGVALETWKVSVEGGAITMHPDERFAGEVATSATHPDIAVRLAHPRLGVHYYLRRAAESP
jgi:hypothetical protein